MTEITGVQYNDDNIKSSASTGLQQNKPQEQDGSSNITKHNN